MDFEVAGITELRINAKAAITGINQLAKRLEQADVKIAQHNAAISNMQQIIDKQTEKMNIMLAKLYEAGVR